MITILCHLDFREIKLLEEKKWPLLSILPRKDVCVGVHLSWPWRDLVAIHDHILHLVVRELAENEVKGFEQKLLSEDLTALKIKVL